ncbi:MAG: TonB-dependent receptor [Syntrophobacteraceae bacterium]
MSFIRRKRKGGYWTGVAFLALIGSFCWALPGLAWADADAPTTTAQASSSDTSESQKPTTRLPEIVVEERSDSMLGIADTSTQGTIGEQELEDRPFSRPGEVLEEMPGVIVTQHSGDGKANQYFLRGFNLDHGTDLASFFDGIPINLPSNAHGEGYTDLNFLIPELIKKIDYGKGPYYANVGDYGSAGWENIQYVQTLPAGIAKMEFGSWNYERGLLAASTKCGQDNLLGALEIVHTDGPWDVPENFVKYNGYASYSHGDASQGWSASALGYHGTWNATNQIPAIAVAEGLIDRFGSLSPTDGGLTDRYTLSAEYHQADENSVTKIMGYSYYYKMGLWNDFTFFLDDPVHGDQFEQKDSRWVQGVRASRTYFGQWCNMPVENTFGLDVRNDVISDGLFHTEDRVVLSTTRTDNVVETDVAPYFENKIKWLPWFRTVVGFREDFINFDSNNTFTYFTNGPNPADSGDRFESTPEPKLSLIFGPWAQTEFYLNGGMGFHTDDARGANTTEDPKTGQPVERALPIAQTEGAEVGVRTLAVPHLQSTLTLWVLKLQSELVFDGDIGTNVPSPYHSLRQGVEWANYYTPAKWLTIDADFAASGAHFTGNPVGGAYVPEAANVVIASGVTVHDLKGWHSSLRWRYFGPRYLTQDGSERSPGTSLLYYNLGYQINKRWSIEGDIFNLLNAKADDIDYFYTYRLQGEPAAGVSGDVFHPAEPRTFRVALTMRF